MKAKTKSLIKSKVLEERIKARKRTIPIKD
jgi:hypothetical protein